MVLPCQPLWLLQSVGSVGSERSHWGTHRLNWGGFELERFRCILHACTKRWSWCQLPSSASKKIISDSSLAVASGLLLCGHRQLQQHVTTAPRMPLLPLV